MTGIVVVFERLEEARGIRSLLVRSGYEVSAVCTQGGQALAQVEELDGGVLISGYKFADMTYAELAEELPRGFVMLLVAQGALLAEGVEEGVVALSMPLKTTDLLSTLDMMLSTQARERKRAHQQPRQRSAEELAIIGEAKSVLMGRNHMSEEEAHRYLQKRSMESGTGLVEAAQMVIALLER